MGPVHGFGQLWQKTYRIRFEGARVPDTTVIAQWKSNFPAFWPRGNRMYSASTSLKPGDVGVINTNAPGNVTLRVHWYLRDLRRDVSFTFMRRGPPLGGQITFSADEEGDATHAQIQVLVRANDPIWEIGMRLGMSAAEDQFWLTTLQNVAAYFNATGKPVMK